MTGGRTRNVAAFVRARRAGWERLEALAARAESGRLPLAEVEELDRLYRRAAGDLAFARAAFPGSDAEGYLAQVTARAYGALYRPRGAGPPARPAGSSARGPGGVPPAPARRSPSRRRSSSARRRRRARGRARARGGRLLVPERVRDAVAARPASGRAPAARRARASPARRSCTTT